MIDIQRLLAGVPEALTPYYSVAADQRSILLYRGPARWRSKKVDTRLEDSLVYLDLQPKPHLFIDGVLPQAQAFIDWFSPARKVLLPPMRQLPAPPIERIRPPEIGEGSVTQRVPPTGINVGVRRRTHYVDFVILNYLDISAGHPIRYADGSMVGGRLRLESGGWRVTIDPVAASGDVFRRLSEDGGVAITHVARLDRSAGDDFNPGEALRVLECLHYLLWFTKGSSCAQLLPVGFDRRERAIWAYWNSPWVEPFVTAYSWIDSIHAQEQISQLFPLFMTLWQNPVYNAAVRVALRSYLDANAANPLQSAIALAQLSLESLAYAHLVTAHHDPPAFRSRANVTIRRLLELTSVPRSLPSGVRSLKTIQPPHWTRDPWDGPSSVTWLRNYAMHGERTPPEPSWRNWFHGWQLSCWYVEMVLLSLCGYRGMYRSRIHADTGTGSVHRVPWAR